MDPKVVLLPGLMLAIFTLLPLIECLGLLLRVMRIRARGVRTRAVVTRVFFQEEGEHTAAFIEVRYQGTDGKTYRLESGTGTIFNLHMLDQETDVIHDFQDPSRAFIVRDVRTSLFVVLPLIAGLHATGHALFWYAVGNLG